MTQTIGTMTHTKNTTILSKEDGLPKEENYVVVVKTEAFASVFGYLKND